MFKDLSLSLLYTLGLKTQEMFFFKILGIGKGPSFELLEKLLGAIRYCF